MRREANAMKNICLFWVACSFVAPLMANGSLQMWRENGVAAKVIAKVPEVKIYNRPGGNVVGTMVQLAFAFVFDSDGKKLKEGHYQVGYENGQPLGYVHADDVAEWNHRECVRFTALAGRKHGFVYSDAAKVEASIIAGEDDPRDALSKEPGDTSNKRYKMLLPVLSQTHVRKGNQRVPIYEVAYLHEVMQNNKNRATTVTVSNVETIIEESSVVNIMFVMDSTASMSAFIDGFKAVVTELTGPLDSNAEASSLNLGLIAYNDWMDEGGGSLRRKGVGGYVTKIFSNFTSDLNDFSQAIMSMSAANEGSQESSEAVFDALYSAVEDIQYPKYGSNLIVLIGDAPGHQPGTVKNPFGYNVEQVLQAASAKNIRISTIRIINPSNSPEDSSLQENQYKSLAYGLSTSGTGVYNEFDGSSLSDSNKRSQFIFELNNLIQKEQNLGSAVKRASRQQADTGQTSKPVGMCDKDYSIVLSANLPDFEQTANAKAGAQFSKGWIAAKQLKGQSAQAVLEEYVMMTKDELDLLGYYMKSATMLTQGADTEKIWRTIAGQIKNMSGEDFPDDEVWATHIAQKQGLPVKEGLLKFSYSHIKLMSEPQKKHLLEKIERKHKLLQNHYDDQNSWHKMSASDNQYTFVPIAFLP